MARCSHVRPLSCTTGQVKCFTETRCGESTLTFQDEGAADQLVRIGIRPGDELVHPSTVPAGDVEIAVLIDVHLVRSREPSGKTTAGTTERAEIVLQLALRILLQESVQSGRDHPDRLVFVDEDADRVRYIGPLFDELTFFREDLDAVVRAVTHVDAVVAIDRHTVHKIELTGPISQLTELHEESAVGVVADDS